MNEKFTYIVLADAPGGTPTGYRIILEDKDSGRQAVAQFTREGRQVEVDDQDRDYEAPEWKAEQLLVDGGVEDAKGFVAALKEHLRMMLAMHANP